MHRSFRNRAVAPIGAALALIAAIGQAGNAGAVSLDAAVLDRTATGDALVAIGLVNDSNRAVASIELMSSAGILLECGAAGSAPSGLASGASQRCLWQVPAAMDQAALAATVTYADGQVAVRSLTWTQARGASFPQGVVVLSAGGVHADTDTDGRLDAGETIEYRYRLINTGNLPLDTLAVTDLDGAVACPGTTLAVGQDLVCTRSHVVTAAEASAGQVVNTVEVTGLDGLGLPAQSSDLVLRVNLGGQAGIAVIKSPFLQDDVDGSGFANLGDIVRYDFIVTNTNSEVLADVELVEPDPSLIDTPITCAATTLDGSPFAGNGSGALAGGDTVLCTATYEIRQSDIDDGQALNLVEVSGTTPLNLVVNGSGASALVLSGPGELQVEKSVSPSVVIPGQDVVYTITVSNTGPVTLFEVQIIDPLPPGIASFTWSCAGAFCPAVSGSGPINELIPAFPAGQQVVFTVLAEVAPDAPEDVLNVVTVLPPGLVECRPAGSPSPCEAAAPLVVRNQSLAIPTLGGGGLLLLALGVLMIGLRARPARGPSV